MCGGVRVLQSPVVLCAGGVPVPSSGWCVVVPVPGSGIIMGVFPAGWVIDATCMFGSGGGVMVMVECGDVPTLCVCGAICS